MKKYSFSPKNSDFKMYTKIKNNSLYSNLMGSDVTSVSQLAGIYHKVYKLRTHSTRSKAKVED